MKKQILIGSLVLVSIFNCFAQQKNNNREILKRALLVSNKIDDSKNSELILNRGKGYYYSEKPNYTLAFNCFKQAAELNNGEAQYMLCLCYLYGQGTIPDAVKAADWCTKAFGRYPRAYYFYAEMIEKGLVKNETSIDGKRINNKTYIHMLKKMAADDGVKEAQAYMGKFYLKTDIKQAKEYYQNAAFQGDAESYYMLGIICLCQYLDDNDSNNLRISISCFKEAEKLGYKLVKGFTDQNFQNQQEVKEWIQNHAKMR